MGIDWEVMFPRPGADRVELDRLIREQAAAFQAMPYHWDSDFMTPDEVLDRTNREHGPLLGRSCRELSAILEFPKYDEEAGRLVAFPGLRPCFRVYPITGSLVLPPQWRLRAFRSFLPSDLGRQLDEWREWFEAVDRGEYRDYLFEVYLHEMSKRLFLGWIDVRDHVEEVASRTGSRAPGERRARLCREYLEQPEPEIRPAPIQPYPNGTGTAREARRTEQERVLLVRARGWDETLRDWASSINEQGWRPVYLGEEIVPFDDFLAQTRDPWLLEFLEWAGTCRSLRMGWFLS